MNRTGILDRVGGLLLLPDTEVATTKQVVEFYGVETKAIQWHVKTNREELESNGVKTLKYAEIKEILNGELNSPLEISPRSLGIAPKGSTIFTRRLILNIGFMLRDSKVAKDVRNQALNIIEKASDEQKTHSITKEKELLIAVMLVNVEIEC